MIGRCPTTLILRRFSRLRGMRVTLRIFSTCGTNKCVRTPSTATPNTDLVALLGDSRARLVQSLRRDALSVAALAEALELSEVAVRHHLQVLQTDGFVTAETV